MDVMKAVKNVLSGAFILALIAMIFSMPQARADGVYGVRETAKEILVEVPKFCRPVKFVWEVQWEETPVNAAAVLFLMKVDDKKSIRFLSDRPGSLRVQTVWRGGQVGIPKFDVNGRPIKIGFLSILALGGGEKLQNRNNWAFILSDGKVMNISPPENAGTWGKCT